MNDKIKYLEDDAGRKSSGRLMALIPTFTGVMLSLLVVSVCLFKGDYVHPVEIIGLLFGAGLGHKVNSAWKERIKS
jgi:hypothetical protein